MKKSLYLLMVLTILGFISHAYAQTPMASQTVRVTRLDADSPRHAIAVQFPKNNQAVISNINFEYLASDEETGGQPMLLMRATVTNRLDRAFVNGHVRVDFFDADGGLVTSVERDILPRRIDNETKAGRFYLKIAYDSRIASSIIDITWSGKE